MVEGERSSAEAQVPKALRDRYRDVALLGEGGMGAVFRAWDASLGRTVALKLVKSARLSSPSILARFRREAQVLAGIRHPGIVRLLDADQVDGTAYLVMEYLEGPTLAQRIRQGRLSSADTARLGAALADALATVHRAGVLHRDVKPANVLLAPDGTPRLADFGLAGYAEGGDRTELTRSRELLGTLSYLSPEAFLGGRLTAQSDLFALGVVLYECLTGRLPYDREQLLRCVGREPLPEARPSAACPDVEPWLDELVARLLASDPARRPQGADEVRAALERSPREAPVRAALDVSARRLRRALVGAGGGAVVLALALAGALVMRGPPPAQPAPAPAAERRVGLVRGVLALVHEGRLFIDFATDQPPDGEVTLELREPRSGLVESRKCRGSAGVHVFRDLGWRGSGDLRWLLRHGPNVLAQGVAAAALRPAPPPVGGMVSPAGVYRAAQPQAGPLWMGERFLLTDDAGVVTCWEVRRQSGASPDGAPEPPVRWSFAFVPPGQPPRMILPAVRAVGGLVALDDHRVLLAAGRRERNQVAVLVLDVEARAAEWRRRVGEVTTAPAWLDDEADPWSRPLGSSESLDVQTFSAHCPPVGDGCLAGGVAVLPLGYDRPRWLGFDVARRRRAWFREGPVLERGAAGMAGTPLALFIPVASFSAAFTANAVWNTWTPPLELGGRIYTLASYGGADAPFRSALLSFPLGQPPGTGTDVFALPLDAAPCRAPLSVDPARGELLVAGRDTLYRVAAGSATATEMEPLSAGGAGTGYAAGQPLPWGDSLLLARLDYPGARADQPDAVMASAAEVRLATKGPEGLPRAHEPRLFSQLGRPGQPDGVQGPLPCGGLLVGRTSFCLFAVEPATGLHGSWHTSAEFVVRAAVGPSGLVAAVASNGGVFLVPPALLLRPGARPLAPKLTP